MPEIITKYPEVVIQVLKEGGAECGIGAKPQILTGCPPERFCSLPSGEICVFGLNEIRQTTQFRPSEVVKAASGSPFSAPFLSIEGIVVIALFFIAGALLGDLIICRKNKKPD